MSINGAIEKNIKITKEDEHTGNLISDLFDSSKKLVEDTFSNNLVNNIELLADTGKKITRRLLKEIGVDTGKGFRQDIENRLNEKKMLDNIIIKYKQRGDKPSKLQ